MKLYEIDAAILEVIENDFSFDEDTGEVYFTTDDLNALDMARNEKLEGCLLFIKNCESEAAAIKAEITALQARAKRKQAAADRLREYVLYSMESLHDKTFETPKAYARVGYYQRVDIEDASALPVEYVREKITTAPDKTAIKKAIKAGEEVKGARLVSYPSLTVK